MKYRAFLGINGLQNIHIFPRSADRGKKFCAPGHLLPPPTFK